MSPIFIVTAALLPVTAPVSTYAALPEFVTLMFIGFPIISYPTRPEYVRSVLVLKLLTEINASVLLTGIGIY